MNEQYSRKKVADGRALLGILEAPGFKAYKENLKAKLAEADRRVHDKRLRDENGKYYLGLYDGLEQGILEQDQILKEMKIALEWLKTNGINIEA